MSAESDQKSNAGNSAGAETGSLAWAASANPLASDPELIGDFILESREHLTAIELQLLTLDQDPSNSEAMHAIFRGFHTIKGMAGFLDLDAVRDLAHEVETVLDLARNAKLAITSAIIDRILESKDYLNVWMTELEAMLQTGKTPAAPEARLLLESIRALVTGAPAIPAAAAPLQGMSEAQVQEKPEAPPAEEPAHPGAGRIGAASSGAASS